MVILFLLNHNTDI